MSLENLGRRLLAKPSFDRSLDEVIKAGVLTEFPEISSEPDFQGIDWRYLLLCASVLARSEDSNGQRAALRIADTCLKVQNTSVEERVAAAVVLDTMANKRSVSLALKRGLIGSEVESQLPLPLMSDYIRRSFEDRIVTGDGESHSVNRFQLAFWNALNSNSTVSASAPTSAGKSFLLRLWVAEIFKKRPNALVAFLVPTRALIQEFTLAFEDDLTAGLLKNVNLHSLPLESTLSSESGHLFIFTQERLHILLERDSGISFDLLVVDEAQKIGDGHRGVLLEQVIAESLRRASKTQVVYAAPFVDNPEYLIRELGHHSFSGVVNREVTTVTQNLLFVSQKKRNPTSWEVKFTLGEKNIDIGTVRLAYRPTSVSKRFSAVAFAMQSADGGNLLYANGPSTAETIAQHLSDALKQRGTSGLEHNERIVALIKLIRKTIHPKYLLSETLKNGVAYHYGNMPLLIRAEIESLFRDNLIRFLVCTATLIEGVNLPCKTIFLYGPTKGIGKPMSEGDFWNLAGRAGRWGTEFHGSIVCIDPHNEKVWKNPPPRKRTRQKIRSATESGLSGGAELIDYIGTGYPVAVSKLHPEYDYTVTFLLDVVRRFGSVSGVACTRKLTPEQNENLQRLLSLELGKFSLPGELIFKHPGILPQLLMTLLASFEAMSDRQLLNLAPVMPESDDAVECYFRIFSFINEHLRANWSAIGLMGEKRLKQLAIMAVDWMRGKPLAVLIRAREKVNQAKVEKGEKAKKLPRIIIDVMTDVEEFARFKIPKYLRAFLDVLSLHARNKGIEDKLPSIPDLELWLEMGVSVKTQLSLMELGMSRTGAIEVFELMTDDKMDRYKALRWLNEAHEAILEKLPELVRAEVVRVISRNQTIEAA